MLGAGGLGALLPPMMDILGAPLVPIRPSGHHVLGGLIHQPRGLLVLGPLLPHKTNNPFW
jgi:hypothetical protein